MPIDFMVNKKAKKTTNKKQNNVPTLKWKNKIKSQTKSISIKECDLDPH